MSMTTCHHCQGQAPEFIAPGYGGTDHSCLGGWHTGRHNHYCADCVSTGRIPAMVNDAGAVVPRPVERWTDSAEYAHLASFPTYRQFRLATAR